MISYETLINCNSSPDTEIYKITRRIIDNIAKPLDGLGYFEHILAKISGIQKSIDINIDKCGLIVACADNGVVKSGVAQSDSSVTENILRSICKGTASVSVMAGFNDVDVYVINAGLQNEILEDVECAGFIKYIDEHIKNGTNNMICGPAMSIEEAKAAICLGAKYVELMHENGYKMIATGEAGIGNTTTSAALCSVLLNISPDIVTGRGAGLSDDGLIRKIEAIKKAIEVNGLSDVNNNDKLIVSDGALETLSKVGGLDIAVLAGVFLAAPLFDMPIVMDGVISASAALVATRINPVVKGYIIESHKSSEPAMKAICEELDLHPVIDAGMHIGEGTGAVAMIPLLKTVMQVYMHSARFEDIDVEQYTKL